jgi:hypothetical protein
MILIQTRNLPMAAIRASPASGDLRRTYRSPSRESRRPVRAASKKWQLHEGKEIGNGSLESSIRVRFEMELSRERLPNRVNIYRSDVALTYGR